MDPFVERGFSKAFKALKAGGILLESDALLPCVTRIIVGRRLRNSWWAHPRANVIYDVLNRLYHHREVLTTKLVGGKATLIHKKLWPAVFAGCDEPGTLATEGPFANGQTVAGRSDQARNVGNKPTSGI